MEENQKPTPEEGTAQESAHTQPGITRRDFIKIAAATAGAVAVTSTGLPQLTGIADAAPPKMDTPTISCVGSTQHTIFLQVCGGAITGAPAGFSVQWMKLPAGTACGEFVWPVDSDTNPDLCKGSFSGVPGCSTFNLAPGACVVLEIGNLLDSVCAVGLSNCGANELDCGTQYVFRAFAHNAPHGLNRSDFTANLCCSTESCVQGCVLTHGYWKNHPCEWPAPFTPGANGTAVAGQCALTLNPNEQCACDAVNTINIGSVAYNQCDLLCSLAQSGAGNAVRILAHQLIAATLNVLHGATPPGDCDTTITGNGIADGDALINGKNILTDSVDPFSTLGQQMVAVANCLDLYNNGDGGVPHCP